MPLIKASAAPVSISPFSLGDVENHARKILLRARKQAEELLVETQLECEKLRAEARADGLASGRAEGHAAGKIEGAAAAKTQSLAEHGAKLTSLVTALSRAAAAIDSSRRELASTAVRDVIELAVAIATKVAKRQGQLDPSVAINNVAAALKLVSHVSDVRILIHPSQMAALDETLPSLKLQWPNLAHVQMVEDPTVQPGGCRVTTRDGEIDATLDEQLHRISLDLAPAVPSAPPGASVSP